MPSGLVFWPAVGVDEGFALDAGGLTLDAGGLTLDAGGLADVGCDEVHDPNAD